MKGRFDACMKSWSCLLICLVSASADEICASLLNCTRTQSGAKKRKAGASEEDDAAGTDDDRKPAAKV